MLPASSAATAAVLAGGLHDLAITIVTTALGDDVARLDTEHGRRVLYIDVDADADDLTWAMGEALHALLLGPEAAPSARRSPHLKLVS